VRHSGGRGRLIVLTGLPGAGKSSVAHALKDAEDVIVIDVASLMLKELDAHLPRPKIGPTFLARYLQGHIFEVIRRELEGNEDNHIVLDSIRLTATCQQLLEWHSRVEIWNIQAPVELRMRYLTLRLDELGIVGADRTAALSDYETYNDHDDKIRQLSDLSVMNDSDLETLASMAVKYFRSRKP
jgi:hypothetical protein